MDSEIFSGKNGKTKLILADDNIYETFQLVNNLWILRDIFDTVEEATTDALWGAGLIYNPTSGEELFNVLPMLRNPSGEELFNALPLLRNPHYCESCNRKLY